MSDLKNLQELLELLKKQEEMIGLIRETLQLAPETALIPFSADRGDGRDALLNEILFML